MRPSLLDPLFRPIASLPGLGKRLAPMVERLAGPKVVDLLWHLPTGAIDRRRTPRVAEAVPGQIATLELHVDGHVGAVGRRGPYRVICSDATGQIVLVFFHAKPDYLAEILPVGAIRLVSGKVESFSGEKQMAHPDHVVPPDQRHRIAIVEPVHPLTAGVTAKVILKAITTALERVPALPEWQEPHWIKRQGWPSWADALRAVHAPREPGDFEPSSPFRRRLAYDELLASQLALTLMRANARKSVGRPTRGDGRLRRQAEKALPFALTAAQRRCLAEIDADMAAPERMMRLLQGDVGSGKTAVALMAMLNAVEAGRQAALMAPTSLLARQHAESLGPLLRPLGLEIALLTGQERGRERDAILGRLADGSLKLLTGTHALLTEDVAFQDLALVVVDEQHRFGVHQRLRLGAKGKGVDVLVMTATPIPRTLTLTHYGDLDVSRLDEKPAGRRPIDTRTLPLTRLDEVVAGVTRAIEDGARVYWVCPLVEESEASDTAAATVRHDALRRVLGDRVGLVHGRLTAKARDEAMEAFVAGVTRVLVATTVIEVGVNVPEASIIVIEHAERFGLAQLHQLRGRVGRGNRPGSCLLLYAAPLSETAEARLRTLRNTDDGFLIAEEDLRLRGGGEVLGTRQSGLPSFRLADLSHHGDLIEVARDDAKLIVGTDPTLQGPRGAALRVLLYLFERDAAVLSLRAG